MGNLKGPFLISTPDNFITYDSWKIFYQYDTSEYHEEINKLNSCIQKIEKTCSKIRQKNFCNILINLLENHQTSMRNNIEFIDAFILQSKRTKRGFGIDIGHYLFHIPFGLMDYYDARKIEKIVNEIIKTQSTTKRIVHEQITLIRESLITTSKEFQNMRENIKKLQALITNLTFEIQIESYAQHDISQMTHLATLIILNHQKTSIQLKKLLKNAANIEISELIPHKDLLKELEEIKDNIGNDKFFTEFNALDFETLITTRAISYDDNILIEIEIPLITKRNYDLIKIVSLPVLLPNNQTIMFKTSGKHYLVHKQSQEYIPLDDENFNKCKTLRNGHKICTPKPDSYFKTDTNCESNIFFNNSLQNLLATCDHRTTKNFNFVADLQGNVFYIHLNKPATAKIKCENKIPRHELIADSGTISLEAGCEKLINKIKITTRRIFQQKITQIIPSKYNFTHINIDNLATVNKEKNLTQIEQIHFLHNTITDLDKISKKLSINNMEILKQKNNSLFSLFNDTEFSFLEIISLFCIAFTILTLIAICIYIRKKICCFC